MCEPVLHPVQTKNPRCPDVRRNAGHSLVIDAGGQARRTAWLGADLQSVPRVPGRAQRAMRLDDGGDSPTADQAVVGGHRDRGRNRLLGAAKGLFQRLKEFTESVRERASVVLGHRRVSFVHYQYYQYNSKQQKRSSSRSYTNNVHQIGSHDPYRKIKNPLRRQSLNKFRDEEDPRYHPGWWRVEKRRWTQRGSNP